MTYQDTRTNLEREMDTAMSAWALACHWRDIALYPPIDEEDLDRARRSVAWIEKEILRIQEEMKQGGNT